MNKQMWVTEEITLSGLVLSGLKALPLLWPRKLWKIYCCLSHYGCSAETWTKAEPPPCVGPVLCICIQCKLAKGKHS